MEYRVLGPLEVRDGDGSIPLGGAKQRALLALLLLNANHVVSRDQLIDDLWGERPPETVVQALQVYVSRLRKLLPAETLLTRPPGYLLAIAPDELDLQCFERLLAAGRDSLARDDPEQASALLHEALTLWRGPALAEFAFESFAQGAIGRLEDLRLAAIEDGIEADLALGRHADVIGELEALIAENPQRERLRGALMLALYRSGRQAEALAAYQDARRALVEIGIEPSAELQRLEKAILTHDEALATPQFARQVTSQVPPPRRRRLVAAAALVVAGVIAGAVVLATRSSSALTVPPNSLATIDAKTNTVVRDVRVGSRPDSVAVGHGIVWVANLDDRTLTGVGPNGFAQTISLEAQGMPTGVAACFGAVWVAHGLLGTVSRVSFRNHVPPTRVETIRTASSGAPSAGSTALGSIACGAGSVWVVFGDSNVSRIDPATRSVTALMPLTTLSITDVPSAIAYGDGSVWVTNQINGTSPVSNTPRGTVTRIDPAKGRFSPALIDKRPVSVGQRPNGVVVGGGAVWVADTAADSVTRLDFGPVTHSGSTSTVHGSTKCSSPRIPGSRARTLACTSATISVGKAPLGIAYGAGAVWVANSGDGTVSRIDPATGKVVKTIHLGNSPRRIAVGAGKVWVTIQSA